MTFTIFLIVLAAALLHASWNAIVKGSDDKVLGMASMVIGQMVPCVFALIWLPWPSSESVPWFILSLFFHLGYQLFLISAYKIGDFTQVYPIARGVAPIIVTGISLVFLGVELKLFELVAVLLIICGIASLSFAKQGDGLRNLKASGMAILTGICIAGYSLADGLGARLSESAVGFMAAIMFTNGVIFSLYLRAAHAGTLTRLVSHGKLKMLGAGSASFAAYALVVWAFTQAPIALVTALRETSIIFALLIGILFFGERLTPIKLLATALAVGGAILLRF